MKPKKSIWKIILDILELYIPIFLMIILFISFIIGIFSRYVLKDPLSWTYGLSSGVFLSLSIFSSCYVQRKDEHIVFDLLYAKVPIQIQCIFRIISNLLIAICAIILIGPSIKYLESMKGLFTQAFKIPRWILFICFPITFIDTAIRSIYLVILDVISFAKKTYIQNYANSKEEVE